MITDKIDSIIYNGVKKIGGKEPITKVIGEISRSWNGDEGQLQTNKLNNFSDTKYFYLIRSKIQEETLAGKVSFEIFSATFRV